MDFPRNQKRLELGWQVDGPVWDVKIADTENEDHSTRRLLPFPRSFLSQAQALGLLNPNALLQKPSSFAALLATSAIKFFLYMISVRDRRES